MLKPTLVVMAAGLGSRYGGVKQIDKVGAHGETLLDYSTYDAVFSGFGKVVYIIRPDIEKDFRERVFDRVARNINASYVFQTTSSLLTDEQIAMASDRTKPWGTTHAVLCAKQELNTPFAVINADDYYGREAFKILADYLSNLDCFSTNHAMVGYLLKNTMSKQGSVSRGICQVDSNGYLVNMKENTKIEYQDSGLKIVSHLPEGDVYLSGDEWVSMNFFGFSLKVLDYLQGSFESFIKSSILDPKKECLLPNNIGEMVQAKEGALKVFSTSEKWFGMTYIEDRENVKNSLQEKTQQGVYPEKLWDK